MLDLLPGAYVDNSLLTAVLLGVVLLWVLAERFGWPATGLVVPGYLGAVLAVRQALWDQARHPDAEWVVSHAPPEAAATLLQGWVWGVRDPVVVMAAYVPPRSGKGRGWAHAVRAAGGDPLRALEDFAVACRQRGWEVLRGWGGAHAGA